MAVVITLSSDSESESEVEIVGSYSNKNEVLPLSSVRVEVNALNIARPVHCIDLTSTRPAHAEPNMFSKFVPAPSPVVDLTEDDSHYLEDNNLPLNDCQTTETVVDSQEKCPKADSKDKSPRKSKNDLGASKVCAERRTLRSPNSLLSIHQTPSVELKRLPITENHLKELLPFQKMSEIKIGETMSLHRKQDHTDGGVCPESSTTNIIKELKPFIRALQNKSCQGKTTGSHEECCQANSFHMDHQMCHPTFMEDRNEHSTIPSPAFASSSGKALSLFSKDLRSFSPSLPIGTSTVEPPLSVSRNGSPTHPTFHCKDIKSVHQSNPEYESLKMTAVNTLCNELVTDKASRSSCPTQASSPSVGRIIDLDEEPFAFEDDFSIDSPMSFSWGESEDDEKESFESLGTSARQDDKYYVCPDVKNLIQKGADVLTVEKDITRKPQMLCRQSLSLVYSTIDESFQEGTLQLLSDLLQPGYYPPKDITSHLLWGILLNPQLPHHICVHAYDLLKRAQRCHTTDKWSVPWDWEMLGSVIENQEHRPEILCMFLDYVVQTLEDDFRAKQTTCTLNQSLAKAMLSFDHQFSHIRDVCKWLFSAIVKSTDGDEMGGEYTSIVTIFQRMLSLALEVDCSPAICSAKLSQELFHMLISSTALRPQRMLLLESLESKLLRCKLLEHLLDYSCSVKTSLPMSISLLLHFLKNCTLSADPKDDTEKWRRWEELVCLLWMLLLGYNSAMNGYLYGSKTEKRDRVGKSVYKPEDVVSKCAVHEAIEAFLSRSRSDVGEALPPHVEESLTYLQDHLLDVCLS